MTTVATRNLYIDSEISQGNGLSFRLNLPPSSFCCKPNQVMKLTMSNFEIRKNWYEVNQTNNVFWIKLTNASVSKYFPIAIPPGSYRAFGTTATSTAAYNSAYSYATNDLCSAIAYGINKTLRSIHEKQAIFDWTGLTTIGTGTDVDYRIYQADTEYLANEVFGAGGSPATVVSFNSVTRKFTMTITAPVAGYTIDQIIFLQVKHGIPVAHPMNRFVATFNRARYGEAAFQDSYELLGGVPTRDSEISNNSVADGNTISANKFVSPYVGQLNTLEAIYVRLLSASTNNFQSPGLDKNVPNNYGLVPTNIFARCPLPGAIYDDAIEILTYTEQGESTFTCLIDARQMQNIEFSITDDKGRPLQEVTAGQTKSGNLSAKMTVKWEIIQFEQSLNTLPPSMDIIKSLNPVGLIRPATDLMPPLNSKEISAKRKIPRAAFSAKMSLMHS